MQSDQLSTDELNRISQDHLFYEYQNKLQQAKVHAGIKSVQHDYQLDFNIIKRADWLKRIDQNADERLIESYHKQKLITSSVVDFDEAKKLIYVEEQKRKKLHILRDQIKEKLTQITQSRNGLPLIAASWKSFEARIDRLDYDLSFLSSYTHKDYEYNRVQVDEVDFETIAKIYNSNLSPDSLIKALSKFLGIDSNRMVIASSNPRFGGYECWVGHESEAYKQFQSCNLVEYINFDDSFIVKYGYKNIQDFVETDAFKSIDCWLDPLTLEIFIRSDKFPLNIDRNISFQKISNIEYIPLVAFDYSLKAWKFNLASLISKIQEFTPTLIIRNIYVFNGDEFEVIPSETETIWTFANSILFSLNNSQNSGNNLYIFDCEKDTMMKYEYRATFNSDDLIQLYSDTLKFLKISGFELHSPDKLIEDFLNSEKID